MSNLLNPYRFNTSTPDIPVGVGWYDFSDTSTITSSATLVSSVDDKFPTGNNITQLTATAQPKTGTRTLNGLNVLDFDGGDILQAAVPLVNFDAGESMTIFAVAQDDVVSGGFKTVATQWAGTSRQFVVGRSNTNNYYYGVRGGSVVSSVVSTTSAIIVATYNDATSVSNLNINNSNEGSITSNINEGNTNFAVGGTLGSGSWDGIIGEVIVYNRVLTTDEINLVRNYLNNKWSIY